MRTLVLSLDGILVATDFRDARMSPKIRILHADRSKERFPFIVRPYAREFLEGVLEVFDAIAVVAPCSKNDILSVLRASDLAGYFSILFSDDDITGFGINSFLKVDGNFGLITHDAVSEEDQAASLKFFGKVFHQHKFFPGEQIEDEVICLNPYCGDPDDTQLLDLLNAFQVASLEVDIA